MKRAVIVHCWGGRPEYAWYEWAQAELESRGYKVLVPLMPDTEHPKLDAWLAKLQDVIGKSDEELVLIGHSLGTVTIMRYLEGLPDTSRISTAILVAAFTDQLGFYELENFFESRLQFDRIARKTKNGFVVIQSDDDPFISAQYGERLKSELQATLVIKHNAGHMSGAHDSPNACLELPELLEFI